MQFGALLSTHCQRKRYVYFNLSFYFNEIVTIIVKLNRSFFYQIKFLWDVTKYFDEHEYGLIISAMRHIVHNEIYCSLNKKMFWVWIYLVIYICVLLHFGNTLISRMTTQTTIVTWKKEKDTKPLLSIHFSFFRNDGNFNVTYWFNQMFI